MKENDQKSVIWERSTAKYIRCGIHFPYNFASVKKIKTIKE